MKKSFLVLILVFFCLVNNGLTASYEAYLPYLKDISGWTASEADGARISGGPMSFEMAQRNYEQGNAQIMVSVISGMQAQMQWSQYTAQTQYETADSMVSVKNINGFQTIMTYQKSSRAGSIIVLLTKEADSPTLLSFSFSGTTPDQAMDFAKRFDWKGLSKAAQE